MKRSLQGIFAKTFLLTFTLRNEIITFWVRKINCISRYLWKVDFGARCNDEDDDDDDGCYYYSPFRSGVLAHALLPSLASWCNLAFAPEMIHPLYHYFGALLLRNFSLAQIESSNFVPPAFNLQLSPSWDYNFANFSLQVVHGVHIEPAHEVKKRSISQPLRILIHYDDSVYRFVRVFILFYVLCDDSMKPQN